MEVFLGTIQAFGFNFAPRGWMTCQGQLLAISQNTALFSLLGTYYGGNGQVNFGLPDLQGRTAIGQGNGGGLTPRTIGERAGTESVTLTSSNLPALPISTASLSVATQIKLTTKTSNPVSVPTSTNAYIGASGGGPGTATIYSDAQGSETVDLLGASTAITGTLSTPGGNQPTALMNPYLALNFCIAVQGIFPSRN